MNNSRRKKKKRNTSVFEKILQDMINASVKVAVDSALKDIFKDFK